MEMGTLDAKAGPDRFSTSDEIRAALSLPSDFSVERANDRLWEVPSDLGGHVLIDAEEADALVLFAKLDTTAN